jgi:uncharacterized membrane protein (DUF2068 family)
VDWNLRTCGWRGHETYAPDEADLRAQLCATTPVGTAWRCLRCGTYVVGDPVGHGPAQQAPEVPRGRLLRDRVLMRALAVERGLRAVGLVAVALLVLKFRGSHDTLQTAFQNDLPLLRPLATQLGWNPDDSRIVRSINDAFSLSPTTLTWIAVGLLAYAALEAIEAVGLWQVKRWGEYFAVVATSVFLPLEIYELIERVTVLRLGAFAVNVAAVVWLVWSKRLFGLRGGGAAYRAEHAAESLLTVDRAAARTAD